jgi:uncharacterized membrane protein YfcA
MAPNKTAKVSRTESNGFADRRSQPFMTQPNSIALENPLQIVSPATAAPRKLRYFTPWLIFFTAVWFAIYLTCFPHPAELAARNWPLLIVGICGAVIGNFTAIGGGLVFIPVLMFFYHVDPVSALKLTFVTQAVGMTSGAVGWLRRGVVPVRLLKWTVPALAIGAFVSSFIFKANPMLIKSLFGPICLIAGVLTLVTAKRKGFLSDLPRRANWPVFAVSTFGGLITGWVAIGEGEIVAAFCMLAYNLNANCALGLGVLLLSINSILLAGVHAFILGGVPWDMAIFTMLAVLWGGRMGPFVAQWVSPLFAKRVFASIAILDGTLIFLQGLGVLAKLKGH